MSQGASLEQASLLARAVERLAVSKEEFHLEISAVKQRLQQQSLQHSQRQEFKEELQALRQDFRQQMQSDWQELLSSRQEMQSMRQELKGEIQTVKKEMTNTALCLSIGIGAGMVVCSTALVVLGD